ncbi:alpha/beta fold hydrolase [Kitasatospora sp. NPDC004240]
MSTPTGTPTTGHLRVDGATLHYEVRGEGPLLLLIPGGTGGAAAFDAVADGLAAECTVATYDPRGMARSTLDDPGAAQHVAEHADDALRLLDLLSPGEPARVFGASSGAVAALHLLTVRPDRVRRLVAHEPPLVEVLPDAPEHRVLLARVQEVFRTEGLGPAMSLFGEGLRRGGTVAAAAQPGTGPGTALPPQAAARTERTMAGLPYFLGRIVPAFMAYTPDVDRLRSLTDRLVLAVGEDSRGELPYRPAALLAQTLGVPLLHFPGGHVGLSTHPDAFGERLAQAFRAPAPGDVP